MIHYRLLQSLSSLVLLLACSLTVVESFLPASSCCGPTRTSCKDETTQLASQIRENSDVTFSSRRHFWNTFAAVGLSIATTTAPAHAFERADAKFAYSITIPESLKEGSKPVKTHQDEINFVASEIRGYQYGITVDPVRINSLKEFGTPEEVAARVVTAEVNRDGVFEVTLLKDPVASEDGGYLLEYLSVGKRGNKHYINKIFIDKNELYVLTAQCKQENYEELKKEMEATVQSFRV